MTQSPSSWDVEPLAGLVEVLDYARVPVSAKERANRPGRVPYFGAAGQVGWIDEAIFDEPLVLLGEDGVQFFDSGKPKAYGIQGPAWVNNHAHVLRAGSRVDRRFLLHYLNQFDYRGFANGTTRLKLTQAAMKRMPVALPQLTEQRRIVDILEDHLSRLDAADASLRTNRTRVESLRQRLISAALLGADVLGPRQGASLDSVGTADGDLAELPTAWSWRRLGELADVVGGVTKDAKRQSDPSFVEVPYLRVANVQRGRLDLATVTTIRVPPSKAQALRLQRGDVVMNEGGDRDKLARGWVWEGQVEDCIHQNHVFRARVRGGVIDPYLLAWAANTIGGRWAERNGKQSVNLASISLSKIRLMPVPVPPVERQGAIRYELSARLDACRILDTGLTQAMTRASGLRRALLTAAFSGRLTGWSSDLDRAEEIVGQQTG